jgi:hypothetical protein
MPPQIHLHGQLDEAEKVVLEALRSLPDDCIIYAQPKIVYKREIRYPDFIIVYHKWGVVVLEVKDWIEVVDRDPRQAQIRQRNGRLEWRESPVEQARGAAHVLASRLQKDDDLCSYAGKLNFYYAYGGVLPHLPPTTIRWLEEAWGETYLLGREDLERERIVEKIASIHTPGRIVLEECQVRAVCAAIDARNKNTDLVTGEFKGVYDRTQERIAKEPPQPAAAPAQAAEQPVQESLDLEIAPSADTRMEHLAAEMPQDAAELTTAAHVRLVRGFAGTGKTDVLILRAHYLHEQYPDLDILITTFNDPLYTNRLEPELRDLQPRVDVIKFDTLCAGIYRKKHGLWRSPQDTGGVVARMASDHPLIEELGHSFVTDEFIWMKETGRTERQRYVTGVREGRGSASGRALGREMKERIFDLFEAYQRELQDLPAHDWVDLHERAWRYLREGTRPDRQYDVILVDEAQHFAPTWMRITAEFLKPGGSLFLCDDPSQSVYRYYSWRQKGVEVRGRTRWLRIPYRNTRQIFEAAYALITDNPVARRLLAEEGGQMQPDLDRRAMRDGPKPEVHRFASWEAECEFVIRTIEALIRDGGMRAEEIGILHEKKHILSRYESLVPKGVQLYEVKRQTGLEYKVVFIPRLQEMFERSVGISWAEDEGRQRLKSYMTMTRARARLYMLYESKWPKLLEPVRPYAKWVEH